MMLQYVLRHDVLDVRAAPEDEIEEREEAVDRRHRQQTDQRERGDGGRRRRIPVEDEHHDRPDGEVTPHQDRPERAVVDPAHLWREPHHEQRVRRLLDQTVLHERLHDDHPHKHQHVDQHRGHDVGAQVPRQRRRVVADVWQQRRARREGERRVELREIRGVEQTHRQRRRRHHAHVVQHGTSRPFAPSRMRRPHSSTCSRGPRAAPRSSRTKPACSRSRRRRRRGRPQAPRRRSCGMGRRAAGPIDRSRGGGSPSRRGPSCS